MAKYGKFISVANPVNKKDEPYVVVKATFGAKNIFLLRAKDVRTKRFIAMDEAVVLFSGNRVESVEFYNNYVKTHSINNPIKYWILDQNDNVYLTITKGGREKAEKIADELNQKNKGKFRVMGFGLDDNAKSPYANSLWYDKQKKRLSQLEKSVKSGKTIPLKTPKPDYGEDYHYFLSLISDYGADDKQSIKEARRIGKLAGYAKSRIESDIKRMIKGED